MTGLKLDPAYFFDLYEGRKDYKLYPLSAKRDEKRVSTLETAVSESQRQDASQDVEIAKLKSQMVDQAQEIAALKSELRQALNALGGRKSPRAHTPTGEQRKVR